MRKKPSLKESHPELLKEWDFEKNSFLDPAKINANSRMMVWWKCRNNPAHQWTDSIKNRAILKKRCPFCQKN